MRREEADNEESKEANDLTQQVRIQELERQLEQVQAEAENNKAATDILSQLLDKGEIMQNPDGSVEVIREDLNS